MIPKAPKPARRSNVTSHSYSPETGHLTVSYHSGRTYQYERVPQDIARKLGEHESPGSFLHAHVIGKFKATEITD
jgi:hypothetical protein